MLFARPERFADALAAREVKAALPTTASSAELARIAAEVRERALFSARVQDANFLRQADELVRRIVSPETVRDPATGLERPARPGDYMDQATARLELRNYLRSISYAPAAGDEGGIKDLSSDSRLNLVIRTNVEMAQGYGGWQSGQAPAALVAAPAQELYRLEARKEPRPWGQIWNNAIQSLGDRTSAIPVADPMAESGMVALKNDPIWTEINQNFGLPYPPFAFGSGMWVRDVLLDDAIALGLIGPDDAPPAPQDRGFNDDLAMDLSPEEASSKLFATLLQTLGPDWTVANGVLHKQG